MRDITLSQAVNEALAEEMRRDDTVFIIGEDVAEAGTPFKVLSGLVEEFGTDRVIDTPISEPGFMGMAVGAALTGARPVVDLMFGDFIFLIKHVELGCSLEVFLCTILSGIQGYAPFFGFLSFQS